MAKIAGHCHTAIASYHYSSASHQRAAYQKYLCPILAGTIAMERIFP